MVAVSSSFNFSASTSPARACFRTSKLLTSQSHSKCKFFSVSAAAKTSFMVAVSSSFNFSALLSRSALADSLSASVLLSVVRFSADSAIIVSYSACASSSSTVADCISFARSAFSMLSIATTPPCSSPFFLYAPQVSGGGGGATDATLCCLICANIGGSVGAASLPIFTAILCSADSSCLGGGTYNFGV